MYTSLILDLCVVSKLMLLLYLFLYFVISLAMGIYATKGGVQIESLIHGFQGLLFTWRIVYLNIHDEHSPFTTWTTGYLLLFSPQAFID